MKRLALALAVLSAPSSFVAAQLPPCYAEFNGPVFDNGVSMGGPIVAIRTVAGPLVAGRVEVFTGKVAGLNTVELWSHDAAQNQPLARLAGGSWRMSSVNGWQGANLSTIVPILPGTTFWVVWTPVGGAQASVENRMGPGAQTYRASHDGGRTWTGPFLGHQWKFRIYCGAGFAHYESFGASCAGSNRTLPTLGFTGTPAIGGTLDLHLERALAMSAVILVTGTSDSRWLGLTLPLDLSPFGAPSCTLLSSAQFLVPILTSSTGTALQRLSIPNDGALSGAPLFNQWWAIDALANPMGLAFSNGGKGTIGI